MKRTDGFDRGDQVGYQEGNDSGTIKPDWEGFDPQKGDGISILDIVRQNVVQSIVVGNTSDKVTKEKGWSDVKTSNE